MKLKITSVVLALIFCSFAQVQGAKDTCGKSERSDSENQVKSWPWIVALKYWPENKFLCSGFLVSENVVVAAAQCFQNARTSFFTSSHYVTAIIGKHNQSNLNEPDFFEHEVREIIFHPDWESQSNIHDADIALVVLTETVQFSSNIIKVCLPVSTQTEFLGTGTVVGLVRSNESESFDMDLSQFDLSVVTQSQCLEHEKSATSFCAATSAQSHSQVGDGFLFFNPLTKSYELRGLFSMSINDHSLFTNVGNFVDWIEKKIEESEKVVLEDIEMSCKIYQAKSKNVHKNMTVCYHNMNESIADTYNIHLDFSSHETIKDATDVVSLVLDLYPSTHIFASFGELFPILKDLLIGNQDIKFIKRKDFSGMTQLDYLNLIGNQIEFIPENVFSDLPNLTSLWLSNNKIKTIPENLFTNLKHLNLLNLKFNNIEYLPKDLFAGNSKLSALTLRENPLKIIDIDFTKLPNIHYLNMKNIQCMKSPSLVNLTKIAKVVEENCRAKQ